MTPVDYCLARTGGPGTSLYYCLIHLPEAERSALLALHAFAAELSDRDPDTTADPHPRRARLEWWHGEIERARCAPPAHPVTRLLAPWLNADHRLGAGLHALIDAAIDDLAPPRIDDVAALHRHARERHGTLARLGASVLGADAGALDSALALGTLHGIALALTGAGAALRRGQLLLPRDELARFGIDDAALQAGTEDDAWRAFLTAQIQRLLALYDAALAAVPPGARAPLLPELVMSALHRALLAEVLAADCRVLSQRIALTPLRRLWIAWRTRRQHSRRPRPGAGPSDPAGRR